MNETNPQAWRLRVGLAALSVATLTVFVFWVAIYNGFVQWDDPLYLEKVAHLKRLSLPSLRWIATALLPLYYHPFTWLSHLIDYQVWGSNLAGHHATSILLHGANAGLVCLFVWRLTEATGNLSRSTRLAMAAGVAITFGIHPLQVESVAWLAERKTLLSGMFSLLCLGAYLRAVAERPPATGLPTTTQRRWWWTMTALFLAALLSKPMAVSLPVVMLAMDFYPLRRRTRLGWLALVKEKWLLFAYCLVMGILTIVSQSRAGAVTNLAGLGITTRGFVAARNFGFYIWKLIWPAWLSPYYPLEGRIPLGDIEFAGSVMAVAVLTGFAWWRRRRMPLLWTAWCAYVVMLAPVSGLFQVGRQGAGDRFMYLPMIPVLLIEAWVCVWAWNLFSRLGRATLLVLLGCLLLFYGFRSRGQIAVWHDDEALWTTAAGYFPDSVLANWKLASALMAQHRYEEALPCAQKAARLDPSFGPIRATLGMVYVKTHHYPEALATLQEALRLKPEMTDATYALACVYSRSDRWDDAYRTLRELVAIEPSYARVAATDEELADLRKNPEFSNRVQSLLGSATTK